ncbi:MAG: amidase, Asp-tRNAAsn/Glu-tRNAGln amidotransferase subunit [Myxococcaceae bacterium]|nr:amidase, Asp-tRNAAsn/Glu-tRNAGln amidotransferase subunit [Myxococcaceae bacterium]
MLSKTNDMTPSGRAALLLLSIAAATLALPGSALAHPFKFPKPKPFHLQEATISDVHHAIKTGQITCRGIVEAYLERAKAYNGVCTKLVTADGAPIAPAQGAVRAETPLVFPTETVPISSMLPNLDQYVGAPIDLGRMEPTATDPGVVQQYGIVTGIPHAKQVNALETINLRGERSQTCKGAFDAHPSTGPLPAGAPAGCEAFRQMPDALERAAELDATYGTRPDLTAMPMYCVTLAIKDWYDTKDMRATGGNDTHFAMDAAPDDATLVRQLRDKGAIIYAVSVASQVTDTQDPGPNVSARNFVPATDAARATWGGTACTPYDTARSPGFSSGGSGASVAANLVHCAICETTGGSCRIPANPNAVTSFVTTKGVVSSDGGWTAQFINHRPGVLCRTLADSAQVIDAIKDPETGYFDPKDYFTAQPKSLVPPIPYASFVVDDEGFLQKPGSLRGMRIGVVREFMIKPIPNHVAISDLIDSEVKTVLRNKLKATIVESVDPLYPDDPSVPNMEYTFYDALSEIMPGAIPELFFSMVNGAPEFAVPGYDVKSKDYLVQLSLLQAPISPNLNLRRLTTFTYDNPLRNQFLMDRYLTERDDALVKDWSSFVANSKYFAAPITSGSQNAAALNTQDIRATNGGVDRVKMHYMARLVISKVMRQNKLDVLVMTNVPAPVERNEFARDPVVKDTRPNGPSITDLMGIPEVIVPAGYNQVVYDAQYQLSADKKSYVTVPGTVASTLPSPMPISMMFWGGPGDEPQILRAASAYEAATHHRVPPPEFGPLPGEP